MFALELLAGLLRLAQNNPALLALLQLPPNTPVSQI